MTRAVTHIGVVLTLAAGMIARPATGAAQNAAPVVHAVAAGRIARIPRADSVYSETQVDKPVEALPGTRPAYPAALSAAHIEGSVVVEFVVDTLGRPEVATLRIVTATHAPFADAVRDALPSMRFAPAEIADHHVRQLVQLPFVFTLD